MRCGCGWRRRERGTGSWRWRRLGRWVRRAACDGSTLVMLMLGRVRRASASQRAPRRARVRLRVGVMVQAVWFDAGAHRSGRLLLSIHHLAVDGVSWRILVPELAAAWAAIARGEVPALPARGTSFRRWSQRLSSRAQDAACVGEL